MDWIKSTLWGLAKGVEMAHTDECPFHPRHDELTPAEPRCTADAFRVRNSRFPDEELPPFTRAEIEAFIQGAKDGDFDRFLTPKATRQPGGAVWDDAIRDAIATAPRMEFVRLIRAGNPIALGLQRAALAQERREEMVTDDMTMDSERQRRADELQQQMVERAQAEGPRRPAEPSPGSEPTSDWPEKKESE